MISYKLEFQNANNERIDKGIFNSISEAKKEMFRLIKEMGFECYYTREAKREDYLWIDFGNHHEFFRIYSLESPQKYIQSIEAEIISNIPPESFLYRKTLQDKTITIRRYYGERTKYRYRIYYNIKYGKHYRFKIKNCKHNYKPKNISKIVENFIWRAGVFKLG